MTASRTKLTPSWQHNPKENNYDKRIKGSLELAIRENYDADKNNVPKETLIKISDALRSHYLLHHPRYKEPHYQCELVFD